jgi:predicted ATPase
MPDLPTGTVTLLFTDIEGSTRLLADLGPEGYATALATHRRNLRNAFLTHGGVEVDTQGDAFFVVFEVADQAVAAASAAQEELASGPIRVRMGLHTGSPQLTAEGYVGEDVHLGARIAAAGHGGQVLLSKATRALVACEVTDLGEHRLKDFARPVAIFQLGAKRFPPLKTISNTNLPRPASSFVGREREVAEVAALLRDGARLLTLTGPGGTGKTRLSIEAATELIGDFKAGVFWVPLAAVRDAALVVPAIGATLGAVGGLAEHISERDMLLVVDNLEQVVEAAPDLAALVEACPNLRLLTTSRELLRVRGEIEYAVPPLTDAEAVDLFCTRSSLVADDTIEALCRRLENLPLAVELAAARARVLTPAQIGERLTGRLDLLKGGRDADPRQRTLRAAIEWSYDLLHPDEQRLFARLAVFRGGCTLAAAENVADAEVDTLQSLVDKSLVRHSGERFWMLETIRELARERLESSEEQKTLPTRHAAYFLKFGIAMEQTVYGAGATQALDALERDIDNFRAALEHFEATQQFQEALQLSGAIAELWDQRAHHAEALERFTRLLEADPRPTLARANALDGASAMATKSGRQQQAVRWSEEGLALQRRFGDKKGIALALAGLGYLRVEDGDYIEAQAMLHEAVDLLEEIGDQATAAWATRTLAFSYYKPGDSRARVMYEDTLRRARLIGDRDLEAHGLGALAEYALADERDADAAQLALETLDLVGQSADPLLVTARICGVARILHGLGRPGAAARLISYAEHQHEELGAREKWVADESEETLAAIRAILDDRSFATEWAAGRLMDSNAAQTYAAAELEDVRRQLNAR